MLTIQKKMTLIDSVTFKFNSMKTFNMNYVNRSLFYATDSGLSLKRYYRYYAIKQYLSR